MKNNKTSKKIRKKVNKTMPNKQKEGIGTVKSMMLGLCTYVLCTSTVSFAMSALLSTLPDPDFLIFPCGMLSAAVGALVSGAVVKNMSKMPSLLSGILTAVGSAAMTLAMSLLPVMNRQHSPSFGKAVLFGVVTLGSMLGAHLRIGKANGIRRRTH